VLRDGATAAGDAIVVNNALEIQPANPARVFSVLWAINQGGATMSSFATLSSSGNSSEIQPAGLASFSPTLSAADQGDAITPSSFLPLQLRKQLGEYTQAPTQWSGHIPWPSSFVCERCSPACSDF
jgi:hypothetical protein